MIKKTIITILLFFTCSVSFGHKDINLENIYKRVEQKLEETKTRSFTAKHAPYQQVEKLPIIGQQVVLCHSDSMIWLELENYEFFINSKESNQLVVAYIGIDNGQKIDTDLVAKQSNIERKVIHILDPESAYVFQNAIITYWNKPNPTHLSLEGAIQTGFNSLKYHFGATNRLEKNEKLCTNKLLFSDLSSLIDNRMEGYKKQQEQLNRLVTIADIKRYKALGFTAYYPNPIYLGDMAWYRRPNNMSYMDYVHHNQKEPPPEEMGTSPHCELETLTQSNTIESAKHNKYLHILKKLYPEEINIEDDPTELHNFKFSDFKQISAYVLRGDKRSLEQIQKTDGFWARPQIFGDDPKTFDAKKDLTTIMGIDELWQFKTTSLCPTTSEKAYISTTKSFAIAKSYGSNVYVLSVTGGIEIPPMVADQNTCYKEVAVPISIDWKKIIGTINHNHGHMIGPIFLRDRFELEDTDNFWKILQLLGGKSQCLNIKNRLDTIKMCENIFNETYNTNININKCKTYTKFFGFNQKLIQTSCLTAADAEIEAASIQIKNMCHVLSHPTLDLQNASRRR